MYGIAHSRQPIWGRDSLGETSLGKKLKMVYPKTCYNQVLCFNTWFGFQASSTVGYLLVFSILEIWTSVARGSPPPGFLTLHSEGEALELISRMLNR